MKTDRDKFINKEELVKFLKVAREINENLYEIFYTHAVLGTRISELLLLQWKDVDFEKRMITIPTLKRDKDSKFSEKRKNKRGDSYMIFPIALSFENDELFRILSLRRQKPNDIIFPMGRRNLHNKFKEICKIAKINPNYSSHSFRHLQGIATYQVTKDIVKTALRMRHKDMKTSFSYMHLLDRESKEISGQVSDYLFGGEEDGARNKK